MLSPLPLAGKLSGAAVDAWKEKVRDLGLITVSTSLNARFGSSGGREAPAKKV